MANLILILSTAIPAVAVLLSVMAWRLVRRYDRRRSPLTLKLQNLPGDSLRRAINKHDDAIHEATGLAALAGPIMLSAWLLSRLNRAGVDWSTLRFGFGDALFIGIGFLILGGSIWRILSNAAKRRKYVEGLQAEQMVAQCLTPVTAEGGIVFHDFPTERGNIDHIVIGRSVVFAIETKSRKKPAATGKAAARVRYDGRQLEFPRHTEFKAIEQAAYQAEWLSHYLGSAIGEPVRVVPLLALPGWYVEDTNRTVRHPVMVTNCHNSRFMMSDKFGIPLQEPLRLRIAHALAEKYPQPD